jgi:hypothetical protein
VNERIVVDFHDPSKPPWLIGHGPDGAITALLLCDY